MDSSEGPCGRERLTRNRGNLILTLAPLEIVSPPSQQVENEGRFISPALKSDHLGESPGELQKPGHTQDPTQDQVGKAPQAMLMCRVEGPLT